MDFIHFFGTTGNKEVFFNKIRFSGGLYLSIENTNLIIDPGINTSINIWIVTINRR